MTNKVAIAHWRESDQMAQSLADHLLGVADRSARFSAKLNLGSAGEIVGLLHDLGKYSREFQSYIGSATERIEVDADDYVDAAQLRGKVDHSTAGAQYLWRTLAASGRRERIAAQMLALCIASHHSGLIDCVAADAAHFGEDLFSRRMNKAEERAHLNEVTAAADSEIMERCNAVLAGGRTVADIGAAIERLMRSNTGEQASGQAVLYQQLGLLVRFLFSCLIDADRIDSADFERKRDRRFRPNGDYVPWPTLIQRLETHLSSMESNGPIDHLRREISDDCKDAAARDGGIYSLTVPTGGGKTLASLRFALHHAQRRGLERIVYVIPFTSIIDQNAGEVRSILEPDGAPADRGRVVLEHHGNITPERQTWKEKILCESWDAPVIYTTMVQFLESLFGAGTRGARRMHQLADAVIVFDEVQSLPVKCTHLFNNAVNFLAEQCNSTVVLCTATQPLLHQVAAERGAIRLRPENEIMPDKTRLFDALRRVEVRDARRPGGWSHEDVAALAVAETRDQGSCLVIVNTKDAARAVYQHSLRSLDAEQVSHLSTDMCPTHRRQELERVKLRLHPNSAAPILCVSTQLIEAGVNVDFHAVIRFAAGLDSIAQAAGRCNRNGTRETGVVHVVNPSDELLGKLPDIRIGREKAERILDDYRADPARYRDSLIGPEALDDYYRYYFFSRQDEMNYPVPASEIGHSDSLLNLLSLNADAMSEHARRHRTAPDIFFRQAFMTAADAFRAIDAPTQGIVVPFGAEGRRLIADMCAAFDVEKEFALLRAAQQYTVNVFPHVLDKLRACGAVHEVKPDTRILCLDERYYSLRFGVATEPVAPLEPINV